MRKSNAQKPPKPVTEDDPKQSEAFRKAVAELEAAGELSDIEADQALEQLFAKAALKKSRMTDSPS